MLSRLSVVVWSAVALIATLYFAMAVSIKTTPDISYSALVVAWLVALGAIYGMHRVTVWVVRGQRVGTR